ncbi:hypothetical protein GOP47_0030447 [Adiantum capillus-veneris]|nr:hypothetical protein GOP47_0030447 [Adiantum capillus-veneris]
MRGQRVKRLVVATRFFSMEIMGSLALGGGWFLAHRWSLSHGGGLAFLVDTERCCMVLCLLWFVVLVLFWCCGGYAQEVKVFFGGSIGPWMAAWSFSSGDGDSSPALDETLPLSSISQLLSLYFGFGLASSSIWEDYGPVEGGLTPIKTIQGAFCGINFM